MIVDCARVFGLQQETGNKYDTEEELIIRRKIGRRNNSHKMAYGW